MKSYPCSKQQLDFSSKTQMDPFFHLAKRKTNTKEKMSLPILFISMRSPKSIELLELLGDYSNQFKIITVDTREIKGKLLNNGIKVVPTIIFRQPTKQILPGKEAFDFVRSKIQESMIIRDTQRQTTPDDFKTGLPSAISDPSIPSLEDKVEAMKRAREIPSENNSRFEEIGEEL